MILDRFTQRFLDRPAAHYYTTAEDFFVHSKNLGPLCNAFGLAIKRYLVIVASVVVLFLSRCPLYIAGFIVSIIINAFDCMKRSWSWAKVIIKRGKIINPRWINGYISSSVIYESFVSTVKTSSFHAFPDFVFRNFRFSMNKIAEFFSSKTSTTLGITGMQTPTVTHCGISTNTSALPTNISIFAGSDSLNDGKSSEYLAGKIDKLHNVISYLKINDSNFLRKCQ